MPISIDNFKFLKSFHDKLLQDIYYAIYLKYIDYNMIIKFLNKFGVTNDIINSIENKIKEYKKKINKDIIKYNSFCLNIDRKLQNYQDVDRNEYQEIILLSEDLIIQHFNFAFELYSEFYKAFNIIDNNLYDKYSSNDILDDDFERIIILLKIFIDYIIIYIFNIENLNEKTHSKTFCNKIKRIINDKITKLPEKGRYKLNYDDDKFKTPNINELKLTIAYLLPKRELFLKNLKLINDCDEDEKKTKLLNLLDEFKSIFKEYDDDIERKCKKLIYVINRINKIIINDANEKNLSEEQYVDVDEIEEIEEIMLTDEDEIKLKNQLKELVNKDVKMLLNEEWLNIGEIYDRIKKRKALIEKAIKNAEQAIEKADEAKEKPVEALEIAKEALETAKGSKLSLKLASKALELANKALELANEAEKKAKRKQTRLLPLPPPASQPAAAAVAAGEAPAEEPAAEAPAAEPAAEEKPAEAAAAGEAPAEEPAAEAPAAEPAAEEKPAEAAAAGEAPAEEPAAEAPAAEPAAEEKPAEAAAAGEAPAEEPAAEAPAAEPAAEEKPAEAAAAGEAPAEEPAAEAPAAKLAAEKKPAEAATETEIEEIEIEKKILNFILDDNEEEIKKKIKLLNAKYKLKLIEKDINLIASYSDYLYKSILDTQQQKTSSNESDITTRDVNTFIDFLANYKFSYNHIDMDGDIKKLIKLYNKVGIIINKKTAKNMLKAYFPNGQLEKSKLEYLYNIGDNDYVRPSNESENLRAFNIFLKSLEKKNINQVIIEVYDRDPGDKIKNVFIKLFSDSKGNFDISSISKLF